MISNIGRSGTPSLTSRVTYANPKFPYPQKQIVALSMTTAPRVGLLLCQDLMFLSKVNGAASSLGLRVEAVGNIGQGLTKAAAGGYACIFVDLSLQPLAIRDLTSNLAGDPPPPVIAFGPHVDTVRLEEARLAGCQEVLPRSQFNARLPEILNQYLAGNAPV